MSPIRNNNAFTLLEMIIVLFIISVISTISINISKEISTTITSDLYAIQLRSKLLYAQHYAVVKGIDTIVNIEDNQITSNIPEMPKIIIPSVIKSGQQQFKFHQFTGHLIQYKHYQFSTAFYNYHFKIQFGRGQIYVEKIKK